jgi:hypothetical protein
LRLGPSLLGHADLGVTSVYLQGIDNTEVISTVRSRLAPRADDAGERWAGDVIGSSLAAGACRALEALARPPC